MHTKFNNEEVGIFTLIGDVPLANAQFACSRAHMG